MYEIAADPYCYPGTSVLKNRLNLQNQTELDQFETFITAQRADEPLPSGRLTFTHYRAIHRHLFQDVYTWAGRLRTVRISKGGSTFCYPEHINREMKRVFRKLSGTRNFRDLSRKDFARHAAHFLAELNAIHPFREGNGRTQLTFLTLLAERAHHPLALDRMDANAMLQAMIYSFSGDERSLADAIHSLIA
jgi:cell filamentation protein